jgi:hypothetical protein
VLASDNFGGVTWRAWFTLLKMMGLQFGKAIALEMGVTNMKQAQREAIDSPCASLQPVTSLKSSELL